MLQSVKYAFVHELASNVRRTHGFAKQETINNVQDSHWILKHLHVLMRPDLALVAEYNRDPNVRKLVVERLCTFDVWNPA